MKTLDKTTVHTHTTTNTVEPNTRPPLTQCIELEPSTLSDIADAFLYITDELEQAIDLLKILADGRTSELLDNDQRYTLAKTLIGKGATLADLSFAEAEKINQYLKATRHYQDFFAMLMQKRQDKQNMALM